MAEITREQILRLICDNTGKRINLPNFTIEELEDFARAIEAAVLSANAGKVDADSMDAKRWRMAKKMCGIYAGWWQIQIRAKVPDNMTDDEIDATFEAAVDEAIDAGNV